MSAQINVAKPSQERVSELLESLSEIRSRVQQASGSAASSTALVAVSKYKPSSDILACYEDGQRDFGENYVQELVDKAQELPQDIRWHFIGTLQSNKCKILAAIPNLYAIQTLTSTKAADALNKTLEKSRTIDQDPPLNILLQVNTSGEDVKSGLPPLKSSSPSPGESELAQLARHIISQCPKLHLQGLMTIGSLAQSQSTASENEDFETLKATRDVLQPLLESETGKADWGKDGKLLLSMGMSSDFEAALKAGSDIVRVGTGIFGSRHMKGETN